MRLNTVVVVVYDVVYSSCLCVKLQSAVDLHLCGIHGFDIRAYLLLCKCNTTPLLIISV